MRKLLPNSAYKPHPTWPSVSPCNLLGPKDTYRNGMQRPRCNLTFGHESETHMCIDRRTFQVLAEWKS